MGLVLCTKKNEAVARYSVLNERKQIFASKYMLYLPSEEDLRLELERERKIIEEQLEELKRTLSWRRIESVRLPPLDGQV